MADSHAASAREVFCQFHRIMNADSTGRVRALSLFSGGLDSMLAVRLLQRQGIEVHAVVFRSIFFGSSNAERAAVALKIPLRIEDFTDVILSIIESPMHGFGSGLNPCIDCHIGMLRQTGRIMEREGFQFIITGEVLNQRPMSQNRRALDLIASESGCGQHVLRPLSAKLLPASLPELRGWVRREELLDLQGRSRRRHAELAAQFGISGYPQPAGGCILTDPSYSARLKDLKAHEGLKEIKRIKLLRAGRHFRIRGIKLIVGRDRNDNELLERSAAAGDILLRCEKFPGPSAIIAGKASEDEIRTAAAICAAYAHRPAGEPAEIMVSAPNAAMPIRVTPADEALLESLRI